MAIHTSTMTSSLWLLVLLTWLPGYVLSFTTRLPGSPSWRGRTVRSAAISPGDTVLIVGGTGGVGQLVTKKLQNGGNYKVRVTSRNKDSGEDTIDDKDVEVVELDLVQGLNARQLQASLEGVAAVVISVGTTAFPTLKWKGGNTPDAIDNVAVSRIAEAASKSGSVKRIVIVSSVGVDRTSEMPFVILNLFGVLDAKKSGENSIKRAAGSGGLDYVVVRPGRLVGGPFTNLDVARLLQIEGGAENGVDVEYGDALLGDCKRDACAEAVVQSLCQKDASNVEFSIISNERKALTDDEWTNVFQRLQAPAN